MSSQSQLCTYSDIFNINMVHDTDWIIATVKLYHYTLLSYEFQACIYFHIIMHKCKFARMHKNSIFISFLSVVSLHFDSSKLIVTAGDVPQ